MAELYPILIHSQSIPYLNTLQSAASQIRVLRNTSRQQIRIEYYVKRELSARVEVPSRLSARVGSLLPILIHRDIHPPVSSAQYSTTGDILQFFPNIIIF